MAYWLMKSEPDVYSIDDLKRDGRTIWDGVRNYQAAIFCNRCA
jgi:predicted RNA-binding protein with PUA-like domain